MLEFKNNINIILNRISNSIFKNLWDKDLYEVF